MAGAERPGERPGRRFPRYAAPRITADEETRITHDDVQGWLDRYVVAWRSYTRQAIGELFAVNATYRYHPWDDPIEGRDEIVRAWVAPGWQRELAR